MARNGSGTYSVPNTFTSNATISSSDFNENCTDLGDEITNSVAKDGQTTMTGQLKAATGSVGAPSYVFGVDLDTGFYRKAADTIGGAVGGADAMVISGDGINAPAGRMMEAGNVLLPAGSVMAYAGATTPDGWLLCGGQAVSRTTYADLFEAIASTYGDGDGSTTFNVPDIQGRVIAGKDDMSGTSANRLTDQSGGLDGDTLGDTGGEETHTLSKAELPVLGLEANVTDPGHFHTYGSQGQRTGSQSSDVVATGDSGTAYKTATKVTGITVAIPEVGEGDAHNNVQPTIILNYIIKT